MTTDFTEMCRFKTRGDVEVGGGGAGFLYNVAFLILSQEDSCEISAHSQAKPERWDCLDTLGMCLQNSPPSTHLQHHGLVYQISPGYNWPK